MYSGKNERAEFSERLISALAGIGWKKPSPTRLAEHFNVLAGAERAVTSHSARKWLVGEAIPTQERLAVIAAWLQVQPDWLRFGASVRADDEALIRTPDLGLLRDLAQLDPANKKIAHETVAMLLQANGKERWK